MSAIHQYTVNYNDVTATGTINGFPLISIDLEDNGFDSGPLNPCLVGQGNVLRIEVTRKGTEGSLTGKIDEVQQGQMVDTGVGGDFNLPDGDLPLVIEHTFDSDFAGFSALLDSLQPGDEATMVDFALRVRDILNAGDKQGILELFKPKFSYLAEAMNVPKEMLLAQSEGIADAFGGNKVQFEKEDIELDPCCDNKLWRLMRKNGKQLIRIVEEDGSMQLDLAAGMTADGPKIVF